MRAGTTKRSSPAMISGSPTVPTSNSGTYGAHSAILDGTDTAGVRGGWVRRLTKAAAQIATSATAQPMSMGLPEV